MTPAELHTLNRALLRVAEAAKVYLASDCGSGEELDAALAELEGME